MLRHIHEQQPQLTGTVVQKTRYQAVKKHMNNQYILYPQIKVIIEISREHLSISFIQTSHDPKSFKLQPFLCVTLYLHILLSVSVDSQFPLRVLVSIWQREDFKDLSLLRFNTGRL